MASGQWVLGVPAKLNADPIAVEVFSQSPFPRSTQAGGVVGQYLMAAGHRQALSACSYPTISTMQIQRSEQQT